MNHYELLAILSGKFAETELEDITKKIDALLAKFNGSVHYMQHLGRKKLAYPINGLGYGYYVVYEFDSNPSEVEKLDRELRLSGDVLRHLITSRDEVGAPKLYDKKEPEVARTQSEIPAELRGVFAGDAIDTPTETVNAPAAAPVAAIEVVAEAVKEEVVAAPTPTPVASKPEPEEEATKEEEKEATAPAEDAPKKKKKEEKMNYEDLDKKLDELLKNDIL